MIDDATNELTARFVRHDSTEENMRLLWSGTACAEVGSLRCGHGRVDGCSALRRVAGRHTQDGLLMDAHIWV
jgi:hypothetical protein